MDGFTVAEQIAADSNLAGIAVMMLTSADGQGDAVRCRAIGLSAYLVKPVKPAELHRAILTVLPIKPPSVEIVLPPNALLAGIPDARPLKILLAEDNIVNQRVAVRLLEKFGHTITIANHGGEAVKAFDREHFDVILMDVQMPEVDGFEATRMIRDRDDVSGRRTPIVAMTAHAMKGDRERCLEGGMDEYISKPVQRTELLRVLAWAADRKHEPVAVSITQTPPPTKILASVPVDDGPPACDYAAALERLGGDEELFAEVAGVFRDDAPKMLNDLRKSIAANDPVGVRRSAHGLKGASGYVGGTEVAAVAQQIEHLGATNDLAIAPDLLSALEREVTRLSLALSQMTQSLSHK